MSSGGLISRFRFGPALNYTEIKISDKDYIGFPCSSGRSFNQEFLFQKISELHNSGLGYRRISYWLKENGYKTPRGHEFKNTHVFSILKKRRLREERINKPFEVTYGEWYVKKVKDV